MITEAPALSSRYDSEPWSFAENKQFEACIAEGYFDIEDESTRWSLIARKLGGKRTVADIVNHYNELVYDVELIETGRVPLPSYTNSYNSDDDELASSTPSPRPMKKNYSIWTEDEHRLFLAGLKKFKKSDWKSISRELVPTRSPTQIASHAQKFVSRNQASNDKRRKRSSIHDITENDDEALQKLHQKGLLPTYIFDELRSKSHVQQPPKKIAKAAPNNQQNENVQN
ncbi:transcription factor DIVARICATA-like [Beta vulgaris subsp. vulgaris]|uniref:transcription factor DIVARICATA-like n=1 Tax=Beta vulgaris subsp. vulgaris TaxID=3555 RepID=UPI00053F5934|nr:transcription factor DIVARICATA-like [Beta vulgaris subsp. vulgaris]